MTIRKSRSGSGYRHRSVGRLMGEHKLLQALSQHSAYLSDLEAKVKAVLSQVGGVNLAVSVIRYQSGVLKLQLANQACATRFRFLEAQLVPLLKELPEFAHLERLVVRVSRASQEVKTVARRAKPLSEENAGMFKGSADLCEDPDLKASLLRLSKHC